MSALCGGFRCDLAQSGAMCAEQGRVDMQQSQCRGDPSRATISFCRCVWPLLHRRATLGTNTRPTAFASSVTAPMVSCFPVQGFANPSQFRANAPIRSGRSAVRVTPHPTKRPHTATSCCSYASAMVRACATAAVSCRPADQSGGNRGTRMVALARGTVVSVPMQGVPRPFAARTNSQNTAKAADSKKGFVRTTTAQVGHGTTRKPHSKPAWSVELGPDCPSAPAQHNTTPHNDKQSTQLNQRADNERRTTTTRAQTNERACEWVSE